MTKLIIALCQAIEHAGWAIAIRESTWAYPVVQLIHFTGLSLWVGTIAVIDFRYLGLFPGGDRAARLARQLVPLSWLGFAIAVTGGFLLFSTTPLSFFQNPAFRVKIPLVLIGVAYHIFVQWKEKAWGAQEAIPARAKVATLLELLLWIGVITTAVQIPNYV